MAKTTNTPAAPPPDPLPAAREALLRLTPPDLLSAVWNREAGGEAFRATAVGLYGTELTPVVSYRAAVVVNGHRRLGPVTWVLPMADFLRDFERSTPV